MTQKSRLRLWVFRLLAAVLVPLLLLGLLELGLRIFGYGFNPAPIIPCSLNGRRFYCDNYKFPWRFFPRVLSRDFDPFLFPAKKSENTIRIFILGGSAAQGVPDGSFSFSRILEAMLREAYPSLKFEVINTALTAVNSHVALPLARACVRHQADLLIVYMGNNEVVGPYGPGTVFSPFSSSLGLIRFNIALKTLRLGQLIGALFQAVSPGKNAPRVWRGMEMFLQRQVPADDAQLNVVYRHFKKNLEDIRLAAQGRGCPIIFCTVGSNLKDCPPFASQHRLDLSAARLEEWEGLYRRAIQEEALADSAAAVGDYLSAAAIDPSFADLYFRLGRIYWQSGDYEQSRQSFLKARDLDTLRFRADSAINRCLRETAAGREAEGVYVADIENTFAAESVGGIPGQELFLDHVHMNFRGNTLIAQALFSQIASLLPGKMKRSVRPAAGVPSAETCAAKLAYGDWDRYQVAAEMLDAYFQDPPFTNQLDHAAQISKMEQELAGLRARLTPDVLRESAAQYDRAIGQWPEDWWLHWKYAQLLSLGLSKDREAVDQYRAVARLVPHSFRGYYGMGLMQVRLHDAEGATTSCLKALAINPAKAEVQNALALAYQLRDWPDKAEARFKKAIALQPYYGTAYANLAQLYARGHRLPEAVAVCRRGLEVVPDSPELSLALADSLSQMGRREEAIAELKKAQSRDPRNEAVNRKLNEMLWEKINKKIP
jgi:tetratricopeptide (TPR) repeat protein